MCMITYVPAGVDIPVKGITNGAIINNDGHGWVVAKGDTLLVGKSMDVQVALDAMMEARDDLGSGALAMFHSRYGTHGEMGEYNIHPFYVNGREDSVMAHNGILPSKYHPGLKDRRSDTRIFVDRLGSIVDNPNGVPSRRGATLLGRRITDANKLVFISTRSGRPKVRIVNAHQGIQVDGIWYSNSGYLTDYSWYGWSNRKHNDTYTIGGQRPSGWTNVAWGSEAEPFEYDAAGKEVVKYSNPEKCPNCGSMDLDYKLGICMECVTCLDCSDNYSYCMCWRPGESFQSRQWADDAEAYIESVEGKSMDQAVAEADEAEAREAIPTIG